MRLVVPGHPEGRRQAVDAETEVADPFLERSVLQQRMMHGLVREEAEAAPAVARDDGGETTINNDPVAALEIEGLGNAIAISVPELGVSVPNYIPAAGETLCMDNVISPMSGDVDNDGVVALNDRLLINRTLLGELSLNCSWLSRGDLYPVGNGDGRVGLADLLLLENLF